MNVEAEANLARLPCGANCHCLISSSSSALYKIMSFGLVRLDHVDDVVKSSQLLADIVGASLLLAAQRFEINMEIQATAPARPCEAVLSVDVDQRHFLITVARR